MILLGTLLVLLWIEQEWSNEQREHWNACRNNDVDEPTCGL